MVILNSTKWILPGTRISRSISLSSPKCPRPTTVMRGFTRSHLHDSLNNSIRTRNQLTPTSPSRSVFFSLLPPSSHLLAPPVNLPRREGGEGECQEKTRLHTFFSSPFFLLSLGFLFFCRYREDQDPRSGFRTNHIIKISTRGSRLRQYRWVFSQSFSSPLFFSIFSFL